MKVLFFTKWCYSPNINSFRCGSALNPDSSILMNCRYSPWFFFFRWTLLCGVYHPYGLVFCHKLVIVVLSFIIFTCVAAIRLVLPTIFSNLFPVSYNGMLKSISHPNIDAPGEAVDTVWYVEQIAHAALSMNVSMSAG